MRVSTASKVSPGFTPRPSLSADDRVGARANGRALERAHVSRKLKVDRWIDQYVRRLARVLVRPLVGVLCVSRSNLATSGFSLEVWNLYFEGPARAVFRPRAGTTWSGIIHSRIMCVGIAWPQKTRRQVDFRIREMNWSVRFSTLNADSLERLLRASARFAAGSGKPS